MDYQPPPPPQGSSLFEMELDAQAQNHLNTISKWGKFIGITMLVFVILGLLGLAVSYQQIAAAMGNLFSLDTTAGGLLIGILLLIGVLCIVWLVYLLKACSQIKHGLMSQNSERIAEGFKSLKVIFIVSIILSSLSILSTVFTMFG